jgi:hypothetical protein
MSGAAPMRKGTSYLPTYLPTYQVGSLPSFLPSSLTITTKNWLINWAMDWNWFMTGALDQKLLQLAYNWAVD